MRVTLVFLWVLHNLKDGVKMEYGQVYELVFQELKRIRDKLLIDKSYESESWLDLSSGVILRKVVLVLYDSGQLKLSPNARASDRSTIAGRLANDLPYTDKRRLLEVLWRLVAQGVLYPRVIGPDENNHVFGITELGEQIIDEGTDSPYDPFAYIKRLKEKASNLDGSTFIYIEEALQCFLSGQFTGAAVVLGVASENEVLDLIERYAASLPLEDQNKFRASIATQNTIKKQFDKFYEHLHQRKVNLSPILRGELDTFLNGIFNLIGLYRNDAGHPTGQRADRESVYANLNLFASYVRRISELKNELKPQ